jgi:filamentous hemagglutinin family protein
VDPPAKISLILVAACLLAALAPRLGSAQHITIDGRLSPAQALAGPNYTIGPNLGKQVGSNLFHSFGLFGLTTGESATFTAGGTGPISNVIGRVTGGTPSAINGRIQSTIAGANFYLINPSGIVFGPSGTINVSGSFHASTADYLRTSDGAKFQATNPDGSTLSAAPPAAFGFLTATPAAITVNGSILTPGRGGTLGLVGGPVSITNSAVFAPAGTIYVTSAASNGEVPVDPRNTSGMTVTSFGPVSIGGGSTLEVSDQVNLGSGGSVFIRSGQLTIDASEINADHYGPGPSGQLVLRGDNQVKLTNAAIVHSVAFGAGNGAAIAVITGPSGVISADNALVIGGSAGLGDGGSVSAMGGQLTLTNGAQLLSVGQASGKTGPLSVNTGQLTLTKGGQIGVGALGTASGGDVSVTVDGQLSLDSSASPVFTGISSNVLGSLAPPPQVQVPLPPLLVPLPQGSQAPLEPVTLSPLLGSLPQFTAAGIPGNINLTAGSLSILNSGQISAATRQARDGGNVTVSVAGQLTIDGTSQNPASFTGITSQSFPGSTGNAGSVVVSAGTLSIANNGVISGETFGPGRGGIVAVSVTGGLSIDGAGGDPRLLTGISSASAPGSTGSAGSVTVNASTLSTVSNGMISAASFGSGNGGSVSVSTAGPLTIDGKSQNSLFGTGITSAASPESNGNAGNVTVNAGTLSLVNNGAITSETDSTGKAGAVVINAAGNLSLSGGGLISSAATASGNGGTVQITAQGALTLRDSGSGIISSATSTGSGNAGSVTVTASQITLTSGAEIASTTAGTGVGGAVNVATQGALVLDGMGVSGTQIAASAMGAQSGAGGAVTVQANSLTVQNGAQIAGTAGGIGKGGNVGVTIAGDVSLSGAAADGTASGITAAAIQGSVGGAGQVILVAGGALSVSGGAQISSDTAGQGNGGTVTVTSLGPLSLSGSGGVFAVATPTASGKAGSVAVNAPQITVASGAEIASTTAGTGAGGSVNVATPATLTLDGMGVAGTGIAASATGTQSGPGGTVTVIANSLTVQNGSQIASSTAGPGNGGSVQITADGPLTLSGPGSGIISSATSVASGFAGSVSVNAAQIAVTSGGEIASTTAGSGVGGAVAVTTPGALVLDGMGVAGTEIAASATGAQSGAGGSVTVRAGSLTVQGGAQIASITAGLGNSGDVGVTVARDVSLSGTTLGGTASAISAAAMQGSVGNAGEVVLIAGGALNVSGGAAISSSTAGQGYGGTVTVLSQGPLSLGGGGGILALASATASGGAGSVTVIAPQITVTSGAQIASTTAGTGSGGSVAVATPGALVLDGMGVSGTQLAASAMGAQSGSGGAVTVQANSLTVQNGAQVASTAGGLGQGGDVGVTIAGNVSLSGVAADGTASGISAAATQGSGGGAGQVILTAGGGLTVTGGAEISSSTAGQGNGGTVTVKSQGLLSVSGRGGILALASATASGNAGSVTVTAPQTTVTSGAEIASTTAGAGAGGAVAVMTPGALVLDGMGVSGTQIAASAMGAQSGAGGLVTIAASNLTVEGGAQIASSTAGPGKGGDIDIILTSDIVLPDPGPQISARSTGKGDAGTVTVSAFRLLMSNGAGISTEALSANGGNITISLSDFLHLRNNGKITTEVDGSTGNGGNILIDPRYIVLDDSQIIADALGSGRNGNIDIQANAFVESANSLVKATGLVTFSDPRPDINGAIFVLSSELRSAAQVLRNSCAAQAGLPQSNLVEAGRGGLPQDPDATLPALYIAGRDMSPASPAVPGPLTAVPAQQTTARLTMRCG